MSLIKDFKFFSVFAFVIIVLFNVSIGSTAVLASDLITQQIIVPGNTVIKDQPITPEFVICNINIFDALADEWHVSVKIFDNNGLEVFTEIVPGVFLEKGSSSNPSCVTLKTNKTFIATTTGTYTIIVDVNYTQDIDTSNDIMTKEFLVINPPSYSISGSVLEDINYGGNLGSYTGTPRPNVVMELYDGSGNFISSITTANNGSYSFIELSAGNYTVRTVNQTVTSSRSRNGGAEGNPIPIQTYRTDASSGTPIDITNKVGGEIPSKVDASINTAAQNLSALTTAFSTPQSITNVKIVNANVDGINFVFNFSTIVNTNDNGQGSLRQFIINSNILSNTGLVQAGQTSGIESSIFMIPSSSDPLGRPADPNFGGTTFNIFPTSEYPPITDKVKLDGFIQTGLSGNTNPDRPEIVLDGTSAGETSNGISVLVTDCRLTGMIIQKFGGNGIFCNSKIYLGTINQSDQSVECLNNGFHGIQSKSVDYVGDNVLVLEKNGQDGIRIENDLDVDGIRSMENGGWGVYFGDIFRIRRDISQRSYFWNNGLGGISGINGLFSGSYIDCDNNGHSASGANPNEGHGIIVKNAVLEGASSTNNKNDGINAESIRHTEVNGLEKLTAINNGGYGIKVKGTMTADGIFIQDNGEWGILSESGNVYILKDSKNVRNYVWNNTKGGVSVKSGTFKGKFLDFYNNGQGASSDNEGYGLVAKHVIVNGIEVSGSKNDGIKAESINHTRILGQEDLASIENGGDGINVLGNIEADGLRVNNNEGWGAVSEKGSINIRLNKSRNFASYNKLGGISAVNGSVFCKWLFTGNNGELAQNSSEGHGIIAGRVIVQELGNGSNKGDGIRAQEVNVSNGFSITDNEGYGIIGSKVRVRGIQIARNKKGGIKIIKNVQRIVGLPKTSSSKDDSKNYTLNIINSNISDNKGYGIDVEYFENSLIEYNNIMRNSGFDLFSSSIPIQANNNWWGENLLPDKKINDLVEINEWLADSISLSILHESDFYIIPVGKADSIRFSVVNITDLEDSLKIHISDSLGWIENINYNVGINDSTGLNGILNIKNPNTSNIQDKVTISVTSINSGKKVSSNLYIKIYTPIYSEINILEDSLTIGLEDTVFFHAARVDQNGKESYFNATWSSSGGFINNTGMFISDSTIGVVEIFAEDLDLGILNKTHIYVTSEKVELTEIELSPSTLKIKPGDIFLFSALGRNQFGFPMEFFAVWEASGGTIDVNGLFIAGEDTGNYQVSVSDSNGLVVSKANINILVNIESINKNLPKSITLFQNYPNPFNPTTTIKFSIAEKSHVTLTVYDVLGKIVTKLVNNIMNAGTYNINFSGDNLSSGVYFYELETDYNTTAKKLLLVK